MTKQGLTPDQLSSLAKDLSEAEDTLLDALNTIGSACRLDGREHRAADTAFRAVRKIRVMMVNAMPDDEEDLS